MRSHLTEHQFSSQMPLTLQTTTILAEFVGTKQRWSWYPASVKIRHLPGNSSRQIGQFGARATRKIALRYSVSVGRSEKLLRPVPATAPRCITLELLGSHYNMTVETGKKCLDFKCLISNASTRIMACHISNKNYK